MHLQLFQLTCKCGHLHLGRKRRERREAEQRERKSRLLEAPSLPRPRTHDLAPPAGKPSLDQAKVPKTQGSSLCSSGAHAPVPSPGDLWNDALRQVGERQKRENSHPLREMARACLSNALCESKLAVQS